MSGKELESYDERPQLGVKASVDYIRAFRNTWEAEATRYHRIHLLVTVTGLVAAGAVTVFSNYVERKFIISALGLVAFVGSGISTSLALVKRMDMYWRAWRIVNRALIAYDGGLIDFEKLAEAHAAAESIFDDYYLDRSDRDRNDHPESSS